MTRPFQQRRIEESAAEYATAKLALNAIREQVLRLDPDEQRILHRILRQAERLDAALADLHLFLPMIEICFYGIRSEGNTGHSLSAKRLRKLIQRWNAAKQSDRREKPSRSARPHQS